MEGRPRLLVVDDDHGDRVFLHRAFRMAGAAVDIRFASDGEDALDWLQEAAAGERPDLILTDLRMKRVGGLELLDLLDADARLRDIPVVAVSGHTDPELLQAVRDSQALDLIRKPGNMDGYVGLARQILKIFLRRGLIIQPVP